MPESLEATQPFTPEVRAEFYEWIRKPELTNRARMSHEKDRILRMFLRTLNLRPSNALEADIRTQVYGYWLDTDPANNTRLRDSGHAEDRKVVLEDTAFETITAMHCQHAHLAKNKTFDLIRQKFYGITKKKYVLLPY